jgi:hypothetical protein
MAHSGCLIIAAPGRGPLVSGLDRREYRAVRLDEPGHHCGAVGQRLVRRPGAARRVSIRSDRRPTLGLVFDDAS